MRLAKYLSQAGIASRRQAEVLISQGRVSVNGCVVQEVGAQVDPQADQIEFDGNRVDAEERVYILLYKPAGSLSTAYDPQGRPTVLDLATDIKERIYPVGRLDYDTEGLLLLTNDGYFANLMIHPRYQIPKTYEARVEGFMGEDELRTLREGVELDDGITAPAEAQYLERSSESSLLALTIYEGRKRQVKRMCAAVGHPIRSLKRVSVGFLTLEGVKKGQYRFLRGEEVECLQAMALLSTQPSRSNRLKLNP